MKRIFMLIFTIALLSPVTVPAKSYNIDPSSTTIQFRVKNMGIINVKGGFERFKGTLDVDEEDINKSKVDVSIETASINTGIVMRDDHLRGVDFFDAVKFPTMMFISTKVEASGDKLKVYGNLTIKGITRLIVLNVEDLISLQDGPKRRATATSVVNRHDFEVSWGSVIADEVFITINLELLKQ